MIIEQRPAEASINGAARQGVSADGVVAEACVSSYLQYLPGLYQSNPFLGRFLLVFENIFGPIEQMVDLLACYLDPRLTPPEHLGWLASWVGLELDENWPLARRRELVYWAVRLYRWRGTRRGLREHLRLYTGRTPLIIENYDGLRLGQDGVLGENAVLGTRREHWLSITVLADRPEHVDPQVIRQIVEFQKPAHVGYAFEVRPANGAVTDSHGGK
jgi:phage tail-like protein